MQLRQQSKRWTARSEHRALYEVARGRRLLAGQNGVAQDGIDLAGPFLAAENAVMADANLHVMASQVGPQPAAQLVRRHGLADRADVVALALDGQQHGAADGA